MGVNIKVEDDARPHEIVEDVFLGKTGPMVFRVPKTGLLLSALVASGDDDTLANEWVKAKIRWIRAGLTPEDWNEIIDRLDDAADPLSLSHLTDLYSALQEAAAARPTTSSSGSTATPPGTGTEDEPKPSTSTSGDSGPGDLPI